MQGVYTLKLIKWFFIYKWLELKEFVQGHWTPVFVIVSTLLWSIPLSHTDQTPFQVALLSAASGIITTLVLVVVYALAIFVKRIVKDNIEKAKEAASYDVSGLKCCNCGDGKIKIIPPINSNRRPRFKCLYCGFESDVCNAGRR